MPHIIPSLTKFIPARPHVITLRTKVTPTPEEVIPTLPIASKRKAAS